MSSNPTQTLATTPPKARERKKFENWMRKYWGGLSRDVTYLGREAFEYKETAVQTAWEVWCRFNEIKP